MSIGWQIDDLIDNGHYDGMNTGWYYKPSFSNSRIPFSKRGSEIYTKLNREYHEPTVANLEEILFVRPEDTPTIRNDKIELVYEWKYITEQRKNFLLYLRKRLSYKGCILSVDASLSEINEAYNTILEILSKAPGMVFNRGERDTEDDYNQNYARELISGLLRVGLHDKSIDQSNEIAADLRLLTAVVLNRKNEDGEFQCSLSEYIAYLKNLGLDYSSEECRECYVEIKFSRYSFCLCCGKRIR